MKNDTGFEDSKSSKFYLIRVFLPVFIAVFFIFAVFMILKPLRNSKYEDVAKRFLLNNKTIKAEIGEIQKINGIGIDPNKPSRSEEIARALKNGKSLSDLELNKNQDKFKQIGDGNGIWQTGEIVGADKTIEFEIYLKRKEYFDSGIDYFVISEAKFREQNKDWKKISIGWFENEFLLLK